MSAPLKDVRSAIPECTDAVLDAYSKARGLTKAELIREVLQEWAGRQLDLHRGVKAELERAGYDDRGEPSKVRR